MVTAAAARVTAAAAARVTATAAARATEVFTHLATAGSDLPAALR
jgi:hypothetical protein